MSVLSCRGGSGVAVRVRQRRRPRARSVQTTIRRIAVTSEMKRCPRSVRGAERGAEQHRVELPVWSSSGATASCQASRTPIEVARESSSEETPSRQEEGEASTRADPACIFEQQSWAGRLAGSGERYRGRRGIATRPATKGSTARARPGCGRPKSAAANWPGGRRVPEDAPLLGRLRGETPNQDRGDRSDLVSSRSAPRRLSTPPAGPYFAGFAHGRIARTMKETTIGRRSMRRCDEKCPPSAQFQELRGD